MKPTGTMSTGRRHSLRWRLLILVSSASLLMLLISAGTTYRRAKHEIQELMDGQMTTVANLLLISVGHAGGNQNGLLDLEGRVAGGRPAKVPLEMRLSGVDGRIYAQSAKVPMVETAGREGFENITDVVSPWRRLTIVDAAQGRRVEVFASIDLRDKEAFEIAGKAVRPFFLAFPVLLLLIFAAVRSGLRPLEDMASEVASRSLDHLAPLSLPAVPLEAVPLAQAIDRLLERLVAARDNERRFTSDAAHELRSPLAAIRIQAQVARRSADLQQREQALVNVQSGLDRASRLVEQLLGLARLDPLAQLSQAAPVAPDAFFSELLADMRDQYPEADLVTEVSDCPIFQGDPALLGIVMRNLVDNAVRYGGGEIVLFARCVGEMVELGVADDGQGVVAHELTHLRERFYRSPSVQAISGSGLGLAIVERIAELHGARLLLSNRPGGGFEALLSGLRPPGRV